MKVMISMHTERKGLAVALEAEDETAIPELPDPLEEDVEEDEDTTDLMMEGLLVLQDGRVELSYLENELTGMEGSATSISFSLDQPELVSMLRSGAVNTALVFEPGKRHICVYDTPFSSFEICVKTKSVRNELLLNGTLDLDYFIEIHGAKAEYCQMKISVRPDEG